MADFQSHHLLAPDANALALLTGGQLAFVHVARELIFTASLLKQQQTKNEDLFVSYDNQRKHTRTIVSDILGSRFIMIAATPSTGS